MKIGMCGALMLLPIASATSGAQEWTERDVEPTVRAQPRLEHAVEPLALRGFEITHSDRMLGLLVAKRTDTPAAFEALIRCAEAAHRGPLRDGAVTFTITVLEAGRTGAAPVVTPHVTYSAPRGSEPALRSNGGPLCGSSGLLEQTLTRILGPGTHPDDRPRGPAPGRTADGSRVYFEFQVEKPVGSAAGNPAPRYPQALREAGVEGEVIAQFVVDDDGRADLSTWRVLRSSHALFTQAVRDVLPELRFIPAEIDGQKVHQLVQMPFVFSPGR